MPEWEGTRNYAYFAYVKPVVRLQKRTCEELRRGRPAQSSCNLIYEFDPSATSFDSWMFQREAIMHCDAAPYSSGIWQECLGERVRDGITSPFRMRERERHSCSLAVFSLLLNKLILSAQCLAMHSLRVWTRNFSNPALVAVKFVPFKARAVKRLGSHCKEFTAWMLVKR